MRSKGFSAAVVAAFSSVLFSAAAISAPLNYHADLSAHAPSNVEKVWCRHGYCDGYGDGGASVGGLIGGLVGGAIAAGAASSAAQQEAQAAQQHAASCAQRYRSYDPGSNTYLVKGRRYTCQ